MAGQVTVAKLNIMLGASSQGVAAGIAQSQTMLQGFSAKVAAMGSGGGLAAGLKGASSMAAGLEGSIGSLGTLATLLPEVALAAGAFIAVWKTAQFVGWGIQLAAEAEQAQVAFKVLIGDAEQAKQLMSELRTFANETPFEFSDVRQAGRQLLAFGVNAKEVTGTVEMLGEVASGIGVPLSELADIFGRNLVQGKLFTKDLRELAGRGIPIYEALNSVLGTTNEELATMVTNGEVSADAMISAFQKMTGEGGRFHGMLKEQGKTLTGLWSTFKDEFADLARMIGELFVPALKTFLELGIALMQSIKGGPAAKGERKPLTGLSEEKKQMKELQEAAEKAAEAIKQKNEEMAKSGESLAKSLRTPFEVFQDSIKDIQALMEGNFISFETYSRGIQKAADDFANLNNKAKELRDIQFKTLNVGAIERGSSADFEARNRVTQIMQGQTDVAKQQLEVQKRQEQTEKQIRDILKENRVSIQPVNIR